MLYIISYLSTYTIVLIVKSTLKILHNTFITIFIISVVVMITVIPYNCWWIVRSASIYLGFYFFLWYVAVLWPKTFLDNKLSGAIRFLGIWLWLACSSKKLFSFNIDYILFIKYKLNVKIKWSESVIIQIILQ